MPDANPNFAGSVRQNGGWGEGVTAATLGTRVPISAELFQAQLPVLVQSNGNGDSLRLDHGTFLQLEGLHDRHLGRIAPYGLRGPGIYRLTASLRRTFDITERAKFIFGVDCQNVTNTVTFGNNASNNHDRRQCKLSHFRHPQLCKRRRPGLSVLGSVPVLEQVQSL